MAGSCGPLWVRPGVPLQESVSCYVRYGLKPIGDLELVFCSNLAQSRFAHGRTGNGGPGWKHATPSPGHRFPRAQSCGGKPHAGYWISWVPQEKGSAPKLSTCWPCFSLLLSPPLRKSSRTYKKLKKRDEDANREWLLKEARAIVNQQLCTLTGCQYTRKQGMVPFLGLFLHDVPVDQLPDNNDGDGMRQRQLSAQSRKVTVILHEMTIYQHMARLYDLEPKEHVMSFLQAVEPLDEEESYSLSCQLEPPGQGASRKGLLRFFRSHKI
ncbi:ral-GDS-related protein-like isoform X2 [Manis javanica]|uniref:ral-GDS-related protein-like isoform X2 n=1 Tax=Manis javanica TaxID=9974 RepID=UPI003C6CE610